MTVLAEKEQGIKKFANESPCVCFNIRKAARAITQIYDTLFKEVGLTSSQAAILNSTRMLGNLTVNQLADAMATDRTTITRNLKPLLRDGLVMISPGEDKRERVVTVTPKGENLSLQTMAAWEKFQRKIEGTVGKERIERLCRELTSAMEEIKKV